MCNSEAECKLKGKRWVGDLKRSQTIHGSNHLYSKSVINPVPKRAVTTPIAPPTLQLRSPLLTANSSRFATVDAPETFLNSCVGSIFGVTDTWNCGATGLPSHWKRCSLYPVIGSVNIRQLWYSSVSLYVCMKFDTAAHGSWICW